MHNSLEQYERKIIDDEEFPAQIVLNQWTEEGWYFDPHWHEHLELHYIMEGEALFRLNQKEIRARKGSLVVVNSNELHSSYNVTERMAALVIIFQLEDFSRELAGHHYIFMSLIENDCEINNRMESLLTELGIQDTGYKLSARGILCGLITGLVRNYVEASLTESQNLKRKRSLTCINTALQYMNAHYMEDITKSGLAKMAHLSEDRFNHVFKESLGMSPLNYINDIRLRRAMLLLKQGELSVSEVALESGFSDFNHFGRLFKRKYHCTPSSI